MQYSLHELKRILRLMTYALRHSNQVLDVVDMHAADLIQNNKDYAAEAETLLAELAKHDSYTFGRDPQSK
jgi:hypothetical protein